MLEFLVGFRKFITFMIYFIVLVAFVLFDIIDGGQFVDGAKAGVTAFMATNVGEHLLKLGKEYVSSKK